MTELFASSIVEWVDELPPPADRKQKKRGLGLLLIRDLMTHPGQWAKVEWSISGAGGLTVLAKGHGVNVETAMRQGEIYARYLGEIDND